MMKTISIYVATTTAIIFSSSVTIVMGACMFASITIMIGMFSAATTTTTPSIMFSMTYSHTMPWYITHSTNQISSVAKLEDKDGVLEEFS
eukprot:5660550-Ditylum_brightwellii.AAC.1